MPNNDTPIIVTHSDLLKFLTCRRQWYYDYVLDFRPPEKLTGPLALGTRVHAALEAFYGGKTDDPVAWIDQKGREDLEVLDKAKNVKSWDHSQMYEDMIVGRNCIVLYMDWLERTNADADYKTVSVEEKVETPILGGKAILRGKVDLLHENVMSGILCSNDFKTTSDWSGDLRGQLERSYQHWCYLIALQHNYPDRIVECAQYTVIHKVKKIPTGNPKSPLVERFTVPSTRRAIGRKRNQIERIALEMINLQYKEDQSIFYPSPGRHCTWCDYKTPCDIADDSTESAIALLGNGHYVQGTRYDRYKDKEVISNE